MRKLVIVSVIAVILAGLSITGLQTGASNAYADSPDANGNITIEASSNVFNPSTITVLAGQTLNVTFQNDDAGIQHNLVFDNPDVAFDLCSDVCSQTITFNAPTTPGTYRFVCQVHAYLRMGGTLVVQ